MFSRLILNGALIVIFSLNFLSVSEGADKNSTSSADFLHEGHCGRQLDTEPIVYSDDFHWNYSVSEMLLKYSEIYKSGKRLKSRAYVEDEKIYFPISTSKNGPAIMPLDFVKQVIKHLEMALNNGLAQAVFFPDMGHSHFYIPESKFNKEYSNIDIGNINQIFEKFFADPELLILYHTAEQLKFLDENQVPLDDPFLHHRYLTRNFVGKNDGTENFLITTDFSTKANTVREIAGYRLWSSGYNISASENGCFKFKVGNQIQYFDISYDDLPMKEMTYDSGF